jgi:tRNA pseudouridine38-40 synthase
MSLNKLLPSDIRILKVENVCNDFHSQKNAVSKTYRYYIYNAPVSSPFYRNYSWHIPYYMDINLLNTESAYLIGEKNFFSFTGQKASSKTFERIIYEAYWCKKEKFLVFTVTGNGFLKNMVRKIVGSLTAICNKNEEKHFIQYLLSVKDRQEGKYCAPPQGLYLENIKY